MDDWISNEDDGINEGVCSDDERISLWFWDSYFLFFLRGGCRGNSNGGIQKISLCDLVDLREEGKCEKTLAWDK